MAGVGCQSTGQLTLSPLPPSLTVSPSASTVTRWWFVVSWATYGLSLESTSRVKLHLQATRACICRAPCLGRHENVTVKRLPIYLPGLLDSLLCTCTPSRTLG